MMKFTITLLFSVGAMFAFDDTAQAELPPKAGTKVELAVPAEYDHDNQAVVDHEFLMVSQPGSVEACSFKGGSVTVKKVSGDQVFFDPNPAPKNGVCAHLMAPLEKFKAWYPDAVKKQKAEWEAKEKAFHDQLRAEVSAIVDMGADPCASQDKDLKVGKVYKVGGRVYLYGRGTSATSFAGGQCQVELGSFLEIIGFNHADDHAVAVFHRAGGSTGQVLTGSHHDKTATCQDKQIIVFSVKSMKQHVQFTEPSTKENLEVKGIAAVLGERHRACQVDVIGSRSTSNEQLRKVGRNADEPEAAPAAAVSGAGEPGDATKAQ